MALATWIVLLFVFFLDQRQIWLQNWISFVEIWWQLFNLFFLWWAFFLTCISIPVTWSFWTTATKTYADRACSSRIWFLVRFWLFRDSCKWLIRALFNRLWLWLANGSRFLLCASRVRLHHIRMMPQKNLILWLIFYMVSKNVCGYFCSWLNFLWF